MAETYKGKSLELGGGGRFARLVDQLIRRGLAAKRARAIAAAIGRKRYGARRMAAFAAAGRRRKKRRARRL